MEPEKGIGLSASRGPELKLSLDPVLCPREQGQQTAGSWKDPESSPKLPDLRESYVNTDPALPGHTGHSAMSLRRCPRNGSWLGCTDTWQGMYIGVHRRS